MHRKVSARRALVLAGASIAALGGGAEAAQTAANAPAPIMSLTQADIERVVVTGFLEQDLPKLLSQMGTRVNVVTSTQIDNGGYVDVGQSLQATVPGLYVAPKNGPFDYVDVSLHGGRTDDVLWTVDGVRINNRLYSGTTPIDTLPSSMIERIEVLEGTQALFYGTQAIAGAINIVTKDFSDTADGRVAIGGDTNSGRHVDGYFRDSIDGHRFVVYGSADKSDGYQPYRAADYQPSALHRNRGYEVLTLGGKYSYDFNPDLRFTLSEQHTDAKLDFAAPSGRATSFNERNEDILSAKFDYTPSDRVQFFLKGYYHWWYAYFTRYDSILNSSGNLTGNLSVIDNHDFWGFTDYGLNALSKFKPTRGLETYLGYDYQNYQGSDAVLVISRQTEHVHAFFGEIATTRDLIKDVQFAAGFRYNAPSAGQSITVWNLSGRWDATDNFFVKGMVGTGFRLPTAEELFANDPNDERGNPNTQPEQSTNFNASVGGTFSSGAIRWEAIGFYRDIDHLIGLVSFDSTTNQDVFGNLPGKVKVRGGEFVLGADVNDDVSANVSFTASSSEDSSHLQIRRVPEQLVKFLVDYHPESLPFGLFGAVNYVGDVFDTQGGVRSNIGGYAVIDVGARVFLDKDRKHRVNLGIRNLFDSEYTTRLTRGFPDKGGPAYLVGNLGLPRTFYASYGFNF